MVCRKSRVWNLKGEKGGEEAKSWSEKTSGNNVSSCFFRVCFDFQPAPKSTARCHPFPITALLPHNVFGSTKHNVHLPDWPWPVRAGGLPPSPPTFMTKGKSQPSWVPPALPTMTISGDSRADLEKIAGPKPGLEVSGMFPNSLFTSSEDWAHYIAPQGRENISNPTERLYMTRLTHIPFFNPLWIKGRRLGTLRVAAVSFGEDMMETLGVLSALFIWEMYSDASLCSQIHNRYPDQGMCKIVWWELKISRLVKNTEQEAWTPSGEDERDSKILDFHMYACTEMILLRERSHPRMRTGGCEESPVVWGSQIPADSCCQTSRLCRRIWLN